MTRETLQIPLRNRAGEITAYAIIDAADEPLIAGRSWRGLFCTQSRIYAEAWESGRHVLMHRVLMGIDNTSPDLVVDHIDSNGLNNTRANLRVVTHAQNMQNRGPNANTLTGFRGVRANRKRWQAYATLHQREYSLGTYDTPEEAAAAASAFRAEHMPFSVDARQAVGV